VTLADIAADFDRRMAELPFGDIAARGQGRPLRNA